MSEQEKYQEELAQWVKTITDDPEQLKEGWASLNSQGQIELLQQVDLSQDLITQHWDGIGDTSDDIQFKFLCCKHQKLDPKFLEEQWDKLGIDAKYVCLLSQTSLPRKLVDDFWESLSSQPPGEDMVKAFAKNVPPEHQPEGFEPDEEDE